MELFDKKYVYLEWDDCLKGKEVFVAYTLPGLRRAVALGDRTTVRKHDADYPFVTSGGIQYALVYYDPNYGYKRAYAQGKQIQYKLKDSSEPWINSFKEPSWEDTCEYRVKPEEPEKLKVIPHKECHTCRYKNISDRCYPCVLCMGYTKWEGRRMTNRELARWLAEGRGECLQNTISFTSWNYLTENKDKIVSDGIKIRGWDETEWSEPLTEE